MLFRNETVIISGGLGDIGRALATAFAENGANIALGDIHPAAGAGDFPASLGRYQVRCRYDQVDVTNAGAVQDWVNTVENDLGAPAIIIANAATVTVAGIREITPEQWSRELDVNLNGAFHLARTAANRLLHHNRRGRIVFIGSWAAHAVHTNIPAYCVAKAGVRMLCKCMALELAPHHILVNELAPGFVDAGLSGRIFRERPDNRSNALEKVPTGKLISATEVALQAVAMCHPQNQHMTGSTVLMDGGLSLLA